MITKIENNIETPIAQIIFAHGAGADMEHEYISEINRLLNNQKINVLRFNFPYMDKRKLDGKRRPPDKMPSLIACYQSVLASVNSSLPIFINKGTVIVLRPLSIKFK